jgi:MmyB-like transcription regulator ligand binding domain
MANERAAGCTHVGSCRERSRALDRRPLGRRGRMVAGGAQPFSQTLSRPFAARRRRAAFARRAAGCRSTPRGSRGAGRRVVDVVHAVRARQIDSVSVRLFKATATALRLNEVEQKYLFGLCNAATSLSVRSGERHALLDLVAEHEEAALVLLDGALQFVSGNNLCRKLYLLEGVARDTPGANLPARIFEDPRFRRFFEDWDEVASLTCASLRMQVAYRDPRAIRTVAALRNNARFRTHWERGRIADLRHVDQTVAIRHRPHAGENCAEHDGGARADRAAFSSRRRISV